MVMCYKTKPNYLWRKRKTDDVIISKKISNKLISIKKF